MSDNIRHPKSERVKSHHAETLCALSRTNDLRILISAEHGSESVRGLCRGVVPPLRRDEDGFTLLELLIVIGIIAILVLLVRPAFTTITNGTNASSAIYGIKGALENARAYAKANHTYVFVGLSEVDSSIDPSVRRSPLETHLTGEWQWPW
jgi:prepilin-type N-terminal cleavage/methylation domain-containing protein